MFRVVLLCLILMQVQCYEYIDLTGNDNEEAIVIDWNDNGHFYYISQVTDFNDNATKTPSKITFRSCPAPNKPYMEALKEINTDVSRVSEICFDQMLDADALKESMFLGMPLKKVWFRWNDITYINYIDSMEKFYLNTVHEYTIDCHSEIDELSNQRTQSNRSLKVYRVIFNECIPPIVPYSAILQNLNIEPASVKKLEIIMAQGPSNLEPMHFRGLSLRVLIIDNKGRQLGPRIFEETDVQEVFLHHVVLETFLKSSVKFATFQNGKFVGEWGDCSSLKSLSLKSFSVTSGWLRNCTNLSQLFLYKLSQTDVEHTLIGALGIVSLSIVNCDFGTITKPIANLKKLVFKTLPEYEYPKSLTEVDLSNNKISHISENSLKSIFHGGIHLNLSGNPLVCVCETQGMVQLLTEYRDQVSDYDNLTCSNLNSPLCLLADRSLCMERAFFAIGIVGASLLASAAIAAFVFVRYKLTIKAFLYARGLYLSCVREEELDADREYDAFVSFAHPDDEFVADVLLPGLENDYRLCVHTRNWMPGEMIHTQIMESVQKSRRTIIVLSKSFVASMWGMTEFRTAYSNSLREGRVRVICVVMDDVIDDVNLDSELKSYLKSNTYLKFNDPWFWQKLRYAMPHPS